MPKLLYLGREFSSRPTGSVTATPSSAAQYLTATSTTSLHTPKYNTACFTILYFRVECAADEQKNARHSDFQHRNDVRFALTPWVRRSRARR